LNLIDINTKIEINLKQIEFYHSLNQKNQNKTSFLIVIFSFIGIYTIEIIKFPFKNDCDYSFIIVVIIYFIMVIISLVQTYCLIKPIKVSYMNQPKHFYNDVLDQYKLNLQTDDDEILNEYLKATYLLETEKVLENNINVYRKKSNDFSRAFKVLLPTIILYLGLAIFVIVKNKEDQNNLTIQNYKEIINYIDKKMEKKPVQKPKIDPTMVIKTKPIVVKESVMMGKVIKDNKEKKK